MRIILSVVSLLVLAASSASAQSVCPPQSANPPVNPSAVEWDESIDHASIDTYVADIVRASDDVVIQTLDVGLGTPTTGISRQAAINVQPVAFGNYCLVMRAVEGGVESVESDPSETWVRAPGRPSNVRVQ